MVTACLSADFFPQYHQYFPEMSPVMRVCSPGFEKACAVRGHLEWHSSTFEYAFRQGVCSEVVTCHRTAYLQKSSLP